MSKKEHTTYRITWSIDIESSDLPENTPEAAAKEALKIQRDPFSSAVVFNVNGKDIDLDNV